MRDNPEMARCTFCVRRYGAAPKTDRLWLVKTRQGDFLACKFHKGRQADDRPSRDNTRDAPKLS